MVEADVRSAFLVDVFSGEITVSKNLSEETSADGFASVNGDDGTSTIRMLEEAVTAFLTDDNKPKPAQSFDEPESGDGRKRTHTATATRWTPTNSFATGSSASRQREMASWIRRIRTSSDLAWVWQPCRDGTEPTK